MPGNPRECREHAANCRQLAESASVSTAREAFLKLANTWERLASELERPTVSPSNGRHGAQGSLSADRLEWAGALEHKQV
jgi:hypothetical protein